MSLIMAFSFNKVKSECSDTHEKQIKKHTKVQKRVELDTHINWIIVQVAWST